MPATRLHTYFKWKRKCKKKGKLKVYFLNIIEDQYETAIHLVVMIVIIVQIKTDAQKNYTKKVKCKKHEIVWLIFHKKAEVQIGSYFLYLSKHGIDMHINQVIFRKILSILRYRLF